ncbi:hypothetical protein FOY91_05605 [Sphingomonas solaris]|uniref:Glutamate 5-kinase n=1 Tax=Alterirhizorhabdus solaris TaxID=2529389 RepID=A0A558R9U3_9SPHN|nr:hypothetical protein FOY91_05605 [Sphingomonas solaris]
MPATRFTPAACARLVVKIGSALLVDGGGRVRRGLPGGGVPPNLPAPPPPGTMLVGCPPA